MTDARDARAVILSLLADRAPDATICPSEAARKLAPGGEEAEWRAVMPTVHSAVDRLVDEGVIRLSWKGELLAERAGPYRISSKQP